MSAHNISRPATAFLLMDYQNGVLPGVADSAALLDRAAAALALARAAGITLGFVRVGFTPEERAAIPDANKMFARIAKSELLAIDGPGCQIADQVAPAAREMVLTKKRVGAFSIPGLDAQLRAAGIDTLILAGVHTSGVVLSTVRQAADLDYRLFVVDALCADPKPDVHRCLVEEVLPAQAEVIGIEAFEQLLG